MKAIPAQLLRRAAYYVLDRMPIRQSDRGLARDAQAYWGDVNQRAFHSNSHWKGEKGISEDIWSELGEVHIKLLRDHLKIRGESLPVNRVIEWGCGGGANAVHFAPVAGTFVGVDISEASLKECKDVLQSINQNNFLPLLADISDPEAVAETLLGTCDVFICTYVFELLPSQAYGQRILDIAYKVLRAGGVAILQIKYETADRRTRSRNWGYRRNLANMTTYSIDDFWLRAEAANFIPRSISLRPKDDLVHDERYAYFVLDKPSG